MRDLLISALVGFVVGWFANQYSYPQPSGETETVYVDREVPKEVKVEVPRTEYIYRTISEEKLVRDTVYVPRTYTSFGIIEPNRAISFDRRNVKLTYFDPDSLRFVVSEYYFPEKKLKLSLNTHFQMILPEYDPLLGLQLELAYKKSTFSAGIYGNTQSQKPIYLINYKYRIL